MHSAAKQLSQIVGDKNVLFSRKDLVAYSYDATQRQECPDIVVFPNNINEISQIMKFAYREKIPVIARGAGTGISGGTVPIAGGIVLALSRMNRILSLDTSNRRAVVEPGVINLDLQDALAPLGFMYPPDPASQKSCTLGGNIGENAGGPLCFRYGVTSKYVCAIQVVLHDGEVVELGAAVEDPPGYDLRAVLIGSEGTFGIAAKLIVHIVPLPEASKTMLAVFDTLQDAGQSVSEIVAAGIVPAALELMDKNMCGAIQQSLRAGYPTDAEGVLLIEVAGLSNSLDRQIKAISAICQKNRVRELRIARTKAERDALWMGRKGAFGSVARICPPYLVNDGTVPRNKLVQALLQIQEIARNNHVQIATVAHAGDGNLHPLILFDRNKPDEIQAARKTAEEILDICMALGGTISGEHGIGLEKLKASRRMFSPVELSVMRQVKKVFDPEGILNPGKLFPPEEGELRLEEKKTAGSIAKTFHQTLAEIVGNQNMQIGEEIAPSFCIDNLAPEAVVTVSNTEQISEIMRTANKYHKSVIPWGNGSKQQFGPCLSGGDIILVLKNLNQIIDFG